MKCDQFLQALETGGFTQRMRARRHATRCPECAAAQAKWQKIRNELSATEPLTPRQRHLWNHAAAAPADTPQHWLRLAFCSAAIAALATLAVVIWIVRENPKHNDQPNPQATTVVVEIDPKEELSRLAAAAEGLDAQLQSLQQQAERMEAQRQVAMTLDRFSRW